MIEVLETAKAQLVKWIEENPEPKGEPFVAKTLASTFTPTKPRMSTYDHRKTHAIRLLASRNYEGYTPEVIELIQSANNLNDLYEKIVNTPLWESTIQSGKLKILNPRSKAPRVIAKL